MSTDLSEYEVKVALKLITTAAEKAADEATDAVKKIEHQLDKTRAKGHLAMNAIASSLTRMGGVANRVADTMFRLARGVALVGAGAMAAGIYAVGRGLRSFAGYGLEANSSVENLTLSLGTLLAQTERITFAEARRGAEGLFRQMQTLAIESPGTTMQLADVFQMAVGPMRQAGIGMDRILTMSRDTLSVASALRIDLPQVSRDMGMMLTGAAGQDVRLFRTLRAMGLITESTEQWNEMARRTPTEAAERLIRLMDQLGGPAAEAFGRTWSGATSTFSDLVQNFTRVFTGPTFSRIRDALSAVNRYLLRYRSNIESVLTRIGTRMGEITQLGIDRARTVAMYIINNYRTLIFQGREMVSQLRELVPRILEGARRFMLIAAALKVAAGAMTAMGAILTTASSMASIATALGLGGAATAAGGTAAATTAAGGAAAAAGGGGIMAAIGAALAPLSVIVAPLAVALAAVVAAGVAVYAAFQTVGAYIARMFAPVWRDIVAIGRNVWAALRSGWEVIRPIFALIGTVLLANVAGPLRMFGAIMRLVTALWRAFNGILRVATGDVGSWTNSVTRWFAGLSITVQRAADALVWLAEKVEAFARWLERWGLTDDSANLGRGGWTAEQRRANQRAQREANDPLAGLSSHRGGTFGMNVTGAVGQAPPSSRPAVNVDMRGSRIEVRQEFREADPDRVWIRMVEGLASEAIHTTTSPLVSAFSRG